MTTFDASDTDDLRRVVETALAEDLRYGPDATTTATVAADAVAVADLTARSAGVLAGLPAALAVLDATETQRAGLSGLEFGLAIPGTLGGAVWANAGAHGSDIASVLVSADILLGDGAEARVAVDDLGFAYRDSRFKHAAADGSGPPVGSRVVGLVDQAGWAERVAVRASRIAPLAESVSFAQATTLPVAGLTVAMLLYGGAS